MGSSQWGHGHHTGIKEGRKQGVIVTFVVIILVWLGKKFIVPLIKKLWPFN